MEIGRRAFLEQVLGASLLASACAREQRPFRPLEGSLLGQDVQTGHLLRDRPAALYAASQREPIHVPVVIVGGGPSGLSAAYALKRAGCDDFRLLELESVLGGTSRGAGSAVTAYPWGAHYLPVPQLHNTALVSLLRDMGVAGEEHDGELTIHEPYLVRAPEERVFYQGYWYPGLYLDAGASKADLAERARFEQRVASWVAYRDGQGRRAFTLPTRLCSDAPEVRELDRISGAQWMEEQGLRSPRLRWLLDYACRDDYGLTLAQTSAWALLFYFASRVDQPGDGASDLITWPDGNFALVRHLARGVAAHMQTQQVVFDVVQDADGVELSCFDVAQRAVQRIRAEHVIIATPRFISERITKRASSDAHYAPWLVANLHLQERPQQRGVPLAWDNVLYDSPALGYVCATHQRGSDYGPTVLTYYLPLTDSDPRAARQKLYDGELSRWQEVVLLDLSRAHPELAQLTTRLDVFRWGHAMVRPEVGSIWNPARVAARAPEGRLHFAHSDLSGVSLFEEAFDHGVRAAAEVLTRRGRTSVL